MPVSLINPVSHLNVLAVQSVNCNATRSVLRSTGAQVSGFPSSEMSAHTSSLPASVSAEYVVLRYCASLKHSSRRQSAFTSGECPSASIGTRVAQLPGVPVCHWAAVPFAQKGWMVCWVAWPGIRCQAAPNACSDILCSLSSSGSFYGTT